MSFCTPYLNLVEIFGRPQIVLCEEFCTSWNTNFREFSLKLTLKPFSN
jgi:hypothetical protein